jgi:hypothetical protein
MKQAGTESSSWKLNKPKAVNCCKNTKKPRKYNYFKTLTIRPEAARCNLYKKVPVV